MLASGLFNLGRRIIKNGRIIEKTGKPDIPRFLYHVTSKENYNSILKNGMIKTSYDCCPVSDLNGVFMFDMKNFSKRWANTWIDIAKYHVNLGKALMTKNIMGSAEFSKSKEIVLLKIPTKKMDINKLKIRPQDRGMLDASNIGLLNGDSAIYQSIYTRRKNPIEYIYEENIDVSKIQKIGETTLKYDSHEDCLKTVAEKPFEILLQLLKGTPEEKGVKILAEQNYKPAIVPLINNA